MGFLRPIPPPYGKLRGRSTYLLLFLTYLAEKITTDMATPGWALYRPRGNLLNWKLWKLLKSQFKNITHISDIQFGNFIDSLLWYLAGSNLEYKQFRSYICRIWPPNFHSPPVHPPPTRPRATTPPYRHIANPIYYIYFGKFHGFAAMGAGWLKPLIMNSKVLILDRNITLNT